jgi:hypothetical protein
MVADLAGRSGEVIGVARVGMVGKTLALEEGPARSGGRLYGAVTVVDGRAETSDGRGDRAGGEAKSV